MKKIDQKSHLDRARDVISFEINSLQKLLAVLDTRFNDCVEEILKVKGHIIVSGVGKSGIIGRKIAATFAATGTPAFFMHPTDANHGDLGTITSSSLLCLVSKSGNTTELSPVIQYAELNNIPIISITSSLESFVARKSKICLTFPAVPEACSLSHTPTTSSIMSLAIGDALAIALLHARNFNKNQIAQYHPNGALGQQLKLT